VVVGNDGVAVFDALHRRHKATDAMLYAFDLLELNGDDLRPLPLVDRKARLAKLLARASAGIVYNEHTDEDGAVVFRHACKLGFEGIVSKRLTAPYRSGPSRDWIKVKNPSGAHPPIVGRAAGVRSALERGSGQTGRKVRPAVAISVPRIIPRRVMSLCIVVHSVPFGYRFRSRLGKSWCNDDDADSDEDNKGFH
jgi:hypothetical protein